MEWVLGPNWNFPEDDDGQLASGEEQGSLARAGSRAPFRPGSFALFLRLACVGGAFVSVTIGVLANVGPVPEAEPTASAMTERVVPPSTPPAPSATLAIVKSGFKTGSVVFGPEFQRRVAADPNSVCKSLQLGERDAPWAPSAVYGSEWECISTRVVKDLAASSGAAAKSPEKTASRTSAKSAEPAYRMFSMARGTREDDIRYVRFKISARDMAGADAASEALGERLTVLYEALGWPVPELAHYATRLRKPFSLRQDGTTIRFVKEQMTEWSYNLILEFPKVPERVVADASKPKGRAGSKADAHSN